MQKKLTEEQIELLEHWYTSQSFAECMFSEIDNLRKWERKKRIKIHLYQKSMLSSEYLIFPDPKKTEQEIFNMKKRVGAKTILGGRGFGKTKLEIIDIVQTGVNTDWETAMGAFDQIHVKDVLEEVCRIFEFHPFFKMYRMATQRSNPNYNIDLITGFNCQGVNANIKSKNAGSAYERLHVRKLWLDEEQYETDEVLQKRLESKSMLGLIERVHGITSFNRHSPAGKYFDDLKNIRNRINYPRYVNIWTEEDKQEAIDKHGGTHSISWLTNIEGKIVDSAKGLYDMQRVRNCYNEEKVVKEFEIGKKEYAGEKYKNILILERAKNAEMVLVGMDVGRLASPSEIAIIFKVGERFKYIYNISLYQLIEEEQYEVVKFILEQIKANAIGIDITDGYGTGIYERLLKVFPAENLFAVAFNAKLEVGFLTDKNGTILLDEKGKEKIRIERVDHWSINRLKHLLYNFLIEIPQNYKFDLQFDSMREEVSGGTINYKPVIEEDHLHQAFQCLAIVEFLVGQRNLDQVGNPEEDFGVATCL